MSATHLPDSASFCDCDLIHEATVYAVAAAMPPREELEQLAALYKLFADGTRARILAALGTHELCVCDLAALLSMTKSAISHQLKSLRLSHLVRCRRAGQVVYYTLADAHVREILKIGLEHLNEAR
ncbi:MAG: metalloregulator ArsR/SmtB family transcription factor [Zoogloeaceae bacterium]|jgi:DNA-binding transcriptional ArsR family regulator|nr:metalloregulator ArsR/SmtB family transcription factor [Zoogloeaceae bacterium]